MLRNTSNRGNMDKLKQEWGGVSFLFVCWQYVCQRMNIINTNQLSWAINWGRGGADTGWTNDVKRLEALTMTEQIIWRHFWTKNCRQHFLGREFPGRVSKGKLHQKVPNFWWFSFWFAATAIPEGIWVFNRMSKMVELSTKLQKSHFVYKK